MSSSVFSRNMLVYDDYNHRLIWISCYQGYPKGEINPLVYDASNPNYTNLGNMGDKDLIYCGYYKLGWDFATSGYFALLKSDAGEYYIRDFKLYAYYSSAEVTDNYEILR